MRRIHAKEGLEESYVLRLILIHDQGSKKRIQKEDESRARCEIDREGGRGGREGHAVRAEHTPLRPSPSSFISHASLLPFFG